MPTRRGRLQHHRPADAAARPRRPRACGGARGRPGGRCRWGCRRGCRWGCRCRWGCCCRWGCKPKRSISAPIWTPGAVHSAAPWVQSSAAASVARCTPVGATRNRRFLGRPSRAPLARVRVGGHACAAAASLAVPRDVGPFAELSRVRRSGAGGRLHSDAAKPAAPRPVRLRAWPRNTCDCAVAAAGARPSKAGRSISGPRGGVASHVGAGVSGRR